MTVAEKTVAKPATKTSQQIALEAEANPEFISGFINGVQFGLHASQCLEKELGSVGFTLAVQLCGADFGSDMYPGIKRQIRESDQSAVLKIMTTMFCSHNFPETEENILVIEALMKLEELSIITVVNVMFGNYIIFVEFNQERFVEYLEKITQIA